MSTMEPPPRPPGAVDHWMFLGYGEAGATLLPLLRNRGLRTSVFLPPGREASTATLRRISRDGPVVVSDLDAFGDTTAVLSLVSPRDAVSVAELAAPHLPSQTLYVDLNSISGSTARRVAAALPNGRFVDGGIMGPVPLLGLQVPIALSGAGAAAFHEAARRHGLHTIVLSTTAGDASSLKMLWSVMTKGTIGLLAEALIAADRLGLTEPFLELLAAEYGNTGSPAMVLRMLRSSLTSGDRRVEEMREAAETLGSVAVPAWMVQATTRWLAALASAAPHRNPETVPDAVRAVAAALSAHAWSPRTSDGRAEPDGGAEKSSNSREGVVR